MTKYDLIAKIKTTLKVINLISEENLFYLVDKNWEKLNAEQRIKVLQSIENEMATYLGRQRREVCYFEISDKSNLKTPNLCGDYIEQDNTKIYIYSLKDSISCAFTVIQLGICAMFHDLIHNRLNKIILQLDLEKDEFSKEVGKLPVLFNNLNTKSREKNNPMFNILYGFENIINQICTYDAWVYIFFCIDKSESLPLHWQEQIFRKILDFFSKYIKTCIDIENSLNTNIKIESMKIDDCFSDSIVLNDFELIKPIETIESKKVLKKCFQEMFNTSNLKFGYYDDSNPRGLK